MDKSSFYGVKNRASTNLKKVNLHLYISLRKRYTYKTGAGCIKLLITFLITILLNCG
jgi:hypothetical protein